MSSLNPARAGEDISVGMSYSNLLRIHNLPQSGKLQEIKQTKHQLETLRAAPKPAPPKMQTREFLDSLATVDTADPDALQDFFNATQCQPYENEPDLIPIGSHDGVQYFIHSSDIEIPQDWSTTRGQQYDQERFAGVPQTLDGEPFGLPLSPSPSIDSHVRIPPHSFSSWHGTPQGSVGSPTGTPPRAVASSAGTNPSPDLNELTPEEESEVYSGISIFSAKQYGTDVLQDLKYGFGIGRLHHQLPNESFPDDTGFYVICNAIDKSIWIAFDFEPYGETGEVHNVKPEYGDPYGQLPGDKQMIGVQRLFGEDWRFQTLYSLDRGDPFSSGAGRPMATRLLAKPAYVNEVVKAIKEYRREEESGRWLGKRKRFNTQALGSGSAAKQQLRESITNPSNKENSVRGNDR